MEKFLESATNLTVPGLGLSILFFHTGHATAKCLKFLLRRFQRDDSVLQSLVFSAQLFEHLQEAIHFFFQALEVAIDSGLSHQFPYKIGLIKL